MKIFNSIQNSRVYKIGIIYVLIFVIVAAVANYFTWGRSITNIFLIVLMITMWIALYVPVAIFIKKANWRISDFGFVLNIGTIIVSIGLVLIILTKLGAKLEFQYAQYALVEAIARTGEELFFRGFIFTLVVRLFQGKAGANFWAIIISSLLFAIMHTQTFLPSNHLTMLNIFTSALIIGIIRYFTGSILPGIIVHCAGNAGVLGMLGGIVIYCIFIMINYISFKTKERKVEVKEKQQNNSI